MEMFVVGVVIVMLALFSYLSCCIWRACYYTGQQQQVANGMDPSARSSRDSQVFMLDFPPGGNCSHPYGYNNHAMAAAMQDTAGRHIQQELQQHAPPPSYEEVMQQDLSDQGKAQGSSTCPA